MPVSVRPTGLAENLPLANLSRANLSRASSIRVQRETTMTNRSFHLDKSNAKLMGVCSGIANYFDWDANIIRIAFVLAAVFGVGAPVLIYLAIGLIASSR